MKLSLKSWSYIKFQVRFTVLILDKQTQPTANYLPIPASTTNYVYKADLHIYNYFYCLSLSNGLGE